MAIKRYRRGKYVVATENSLSSTSDLTCGAVQRLWSDAQSPDSAGSSRRIGRNRCESPATVAGATPSGKSQFEGALFYRQNLQDLSCWDRLRRFRAAQRVQRVTPRRLRPEIAAALALLLRDEMRKTRIAAAKALAVWGTVEIFPTWRPPRDQWMPTCLPPPAPHGTPSNRGCNRHPFSSRSSPVTFWGVCLLTY